MQEKLPFCAPSIGIPVAKHLKHHLQSVGTTGHVFKQRVSSPDDKTSQNYHWGEVKRLSTVQQSKNNQSSGIGASTTGRRTSERKVIICIFRKIEKSSNMVKSASIILSWIGIEMFLCLVLTSGNSASQRYEHDVTRNEEAVVFIQVDIENGRRFIDFEVTWASNFNVK